MPALVAGIHVFPLPTTLPRRWGRVGRGKQGVEGRDKPGHNADKWVDVGICSKFVDAAHEPTDRSSSLAM